MHLSVGVSIMGAVIKKYATNGLCDANLPIELLTPEQMGQADKLAATFNGGDSYQLMLNAAQAVTDVIVDCYGKVKKVAILCGSGNNGGDGYAVATLLKNKGFNVTCFAYGAPRKNSDADKAYLAWDGLTLSPDKLVPEDVGLIVDALYGAGLDRELDMPTQALLKTVNDANIPVVAIDLPTGVYGKTGETCKTAINANETVTFFRLKPGHVIYPGRAHCGNIILKNIGIPERVLETIGAKTTINSPTLWQKNWPVLDYDTHKYKRGHAVVFSGGACSTGAARLAALAAARVGAGLVTILAPEDALAAHESHLTSVMLSQLCEDDEILSFLKARKVRSVVLGPGFGNMDRAFNIAKTILQDECGVDSLLLDADALTAIALKPDEIFATIKRSSVKVVLTPHEGEFRRVFPDISANEKSTRLDRALEGAEKSGAVVVYKGADNIVASPDGRLAVSTNGTPFLATAGSGDVLSGILSGLLAQQMPAYEAACAASWIHAECGRKTSFGTIAEDLVATIPVVLREQMPD